MRVTSLQSMVAFLRSAVLRALAYTHTVRAPLLGRQRRRQLVHGDRHLPLHGHSHQLLCAAVSPRADWHYSMGRVRTHVGGKRDHLSHHPRILYHLRHGRLGLCDVVRDIRTPALLVTGAHL